MDNELILRLIGEAPLLAFLFYAWHSERKERIEAVKKTIEVLEKKNDENMQIVQ